MNCFDFTQPVQAALAFFVFTTIIFAKQVSEYKKSAKRRRASYSKKLRLQLALTNANEAKVEHLRKAISGYTSSIKILELHLDQSKISRAESAAYAEQLERDLLEAMVGIVYLQEEAENY